MTDPHAVAEHDQGRAAAYDWGRQAAAYWRGCRDGGAPRLVAAVATVLRCWGGEVVEFPTPGREEG